MMNLKQVMALKENENFLYKGFLAKVIWKDFVQFLIQKEDISTKPPTPNIYFKSFSIYFSVENLKEGVTLTSSYPHPEILQLEEFN